MATKSWTVTDVSSNQQLDDVDDRLTVPGFDGYVRRYTKRGGLCNEVDVLVVKNGKFVFWVLPTRGMGIWKAKYEDELIHWRSPVRGPVNPAYVDLGEPSGLGWLDGFDELMVRCGLESNGAPDIDENGALLYPLHGRIANKPAHKVDVSIDTETHEITIVGVVEETRFHFFKMRMTTTIKCKPGEKGFRINDAVENISASPAEVQMMYHTNFGDPLLDAGSRVVLPIKTVVPRNARAAEGIETWDSYEAPQPGFEEQVYFFELLGDDSGNSQAMLKNAHGTSGARLTFNTKQLPWFTVWKNTTAINDGYVTGLEPATNFPNPRTYEGEQGRTVKLEGGGKTEFDFQLEFLATNSEVDAAEQAIATLQGDTKPTIHTEPQDGWCAP